MLMIRDLKGVVHDERNALVCRPARNHHVEGCHHHQRKPLLLRLLNILVLDCCSLVVVYWYLKKECKWMKGMQGHLPTLSIPVQWEYWKECDERVFVALLWEYLVERGGECSNRGAAGVLRAKRRRLQRGTRTLEWMRPRGGQRHFCKEVEEKAAREAVREDKAVSGEREIFDDKFGSSFQLLK